MTADPLSWTRDDVVIGVLGAGAAAVLFLLVICVLWVVKSRHRHREKLHRRNSIRSSVRSTRSLASSFSDVSGGGGYRRRMNVSKQSGRGQRAGGPTGWCAVYILLHFPISRNCTIER